MCDNERKSPVARPRGSFHLERKEKKGKEVMGRTRWARFLFYKGDYLVFGPETYRGFHRLAVFESYDGRYR